MLQIHISHYFYNGNHLLPIIHNNILIETRKGIFIIIYLISIIIEENEFFIDERCPRIFYLYYIKAGIMRPEQYDVLSSVVDL